MSSLSRSIVLATVAAATLGATALPASAQSYGYVPGYGGQTYSNGSYGYQGYRDDYRRDDYRRDYNDSYRCDQYRDGRTGAGALIGGGAGAVVGSQLAARGRRTEGSILGGVLGAVVGGAVGRSSNDRCYDQGSYSYGRSDYGYSQPYAYGGSNVYYDRDGYGPYAAYRRYDDRRYDRYDRRDRLQISPDGRYVYDPRYGWIPR